MLELQTTPIWMIDYPAPQSASSPSKGGERHLFLSQELSCDDGLMVVSPPIPSSNISSTHQPIAHQPSSPSASVTQSHRCAWWPRNGPASSRCFQRTKHRHFSGQLVKRNITRPSCSAVECGDESIIRCRQPHSRQILPLRLAPMLSCHPHWT